MTTQADERCSIALKEWAVICRALETGRQILLLRKGGIAEEGGSFQAEHERFWLYPTQFHQTADQLAPEFAPLLREVPHPVGQEIPLSHIGIVESVSYLKDIDRVLALRGLHGWSDDVVRQRFQYREPGLFVFALRVYRCAHLHQVEETPAMAGCKSWVDLTTPLETAELVPVLNDAQSLAMQQEIARRLTTA
jgi:hypothetical protein